MATTHNPVRNSPSLLHSVALVGATRAETERNIRKMARGAPPSLYRAANDILIATLKGRGLGWSADRAIQWARAQASTIVDPDKRACAEQVFEHVAPYIMSTAPDWVRGLDVEFYSVDAELRIPVKLAALMRVGNSYAVLLLNLWKKELTLEQKRAALAILYDRLQNRPELQHAHLHFVDISVPQKEKERVYRLHGWSDYQLMSSTELDQFIDRFRDGWNDYQANPEPKKPRKPRPRQDGDGLFP